MTYEEVKALLHNIRSKKSRLKAIKIYIAEERALMDGIGALDYKNIKVLSSPRNNTEERYIRHLERINNLQKRFDILFEKMCAEEEVISTLMDKLSPTEYEVILNRYLRGLSRRATANLMGYSEDGLKDIQSRAIKKMSKN